MIRIQHFFDSETSTLSYLVWDVSTKDAVCIDPVWNFDLHTGKLSKETVTEILKFISEYKLNLNMILETHAHADHISGAQCLKEVLPKATLGIGEHIRDVQKTFGPVFNMKFENKIKYFDHQFKDTEKLNIGSIEIEVINTPGHTPACVSYLIGENLFTGDSLFMPDSGTGRCDFPGGNAETLYDSITKKIYSLPETTKTYAGHDYQPGGRSLQFQSTVLEHKGKNIHIQSKTTKEEYVKFRTERDKTLSAPKLLLPSLQVNLLGGNLPTPESNGVSYLKIPTDLV